MPAPATTPNNAKLSCHLNGVDLPDFSLNELKVGAKVMIGKDPQCDLVIADRNVSRFHLEILRKRQELFCIRDLDSFNGTVLNTEQIIGFERYGLRHKSVIELHPRKGKIRLVFYQTKE